MPLYTIARWDDLYENNRSRLLGKLRAVQIPNGHDGERYAYLMEQPNAAELFTAWVLILQVASRCHPRGTLVRDNGQPHDARSLAVKTRGRVEWFTAALEYFSHNGGDHQAGWLQVSEPQAHGTTASPVCREGGTEVPPSVVLDSVVLDSIPFKGGTDSGKIHPPEKPSATRIAAAAVAARERETSRTLPPNLDLPAFRTAWDDWVAHLQSKHRDCVSLHTLDIHLERCRKWGAALAIAAIDHCRGRNWSDLQEPREITRPPNGRGAPADLTEAQRARRQQAWGDSTILAIAAT